MEVFNSINNFTRCKLVRVTFCCKERNGVVMSAVMIVCLDINLVFVDGELCVTAQLIDANLCLVPNRLSNLFFLNSITNTNVYTYCLEDKRF